MADKGKAAVAEKEKVEEAPAAVPREKTTLGSLKGIGFIVLLLLLEGVAILVVIKASGGFQAEKTGTASVNTSFIMFPKVTATVSIPGKSPKMYSLAAGLNVSSEDKAELEPLLTKDLKPRFMNNIRIRMEQVPLPGTRLETSEQLSKTLARDLREIFNTELLKIEKYQLRYKKDVEKYNEERKDPRKAAGVEKPGPVIEVVFEEFSFN